MIHPSVVDNIKASSDWQSLKEHIVTEAEALLDLRGIDFLDKERASIEGQGRKEAYLILTKILEPFFSVEQKPIDKVEATTNKTGL